MNDAKTLIIVTMEDSSIFKEFMQRYSPEEQVMNEVKVLLSTINNENIFVIGRDNLTSTTQCVKGILSSSCNDQSKIIICTHENYIDTSKLSQKVIMFSHSDSDEIGKEFLKFAKKKISFDNIWNYLEKKSHDSSISQILHLFLSLDIDMQALEATKDQEGYLNNIYTDLEELYKIGKCEGRKENEHYRQKLYDLWFLLEPSEESKERASPEAKKLTPINKPLNDLLKLAGLGNGNPKKSPIYQFLESLDERKTEAINYFLAPFEPSGLKGCDGKEINSFHDWYCGLCLMPKR